MRHFYVFSGERTKNSSIKIIPHSFIREQNFDVSYYEIINNTVEKIKGYKSIKFNNNRVSIIRINRDQDWLKIIKIRYIGWML